MSKLGFALLWATAAAAALFLIGLPISLQAQLIAGSMVVAAMIVLKTIRPEGIWRLISLSLGTAMVMRYVYWRTTETIPPLNQLENFIPGMLLYLAELYNVGMLGLSLFVVAKPLAGRVSPPVPADPPTVDIYVPTYNEDTVLLATTLAAAKGIDYPPDKMTIWLLDDGGTDQKCRSPKVEEGIAAQERRVRLTALCEDLGVNYLTRAKNEHAKAGNLNNGLAHSTGELVAVFDADHAPARDFLAETVGYFGENPKLFLVQTPHFFINPDPLERNLQTFDKMPSENEMFYGIIQRGLDKWDSCRSAPGRGRLVGSADATRAGGPRRAAEQGPLAPRRPGAEADQPGQGAVPRSERGAALHQAGPHPVLRPDRATNAALPRWAPGEHAPLPRWHRPWRLLAQGGAQARAGMARALAQPGGR